MADQLSTQLLDQALGYNRPALVLWPVTTGVPGTGAVILSGAGAWGGYVDIIAAAAIGIDFWLTQIQFDSLGGGAVQIMDLQLYNATVTTTVYATKLDLTAVTVNLAPITLPFFIWCAPGDQIQGRSGGAAARSVNVSLLVATGI